MGIPDIKILVACLFAVSLIYSPDGTNVYGSTEFRGSGSV